MNGTGLLVVRLPIPILITELLSTRRYEGTYKSLSPALGSTGSHGGRYPI